MPTVTPGVGSQAWGRNAAFQYDEEEERKSSRKKGRTQREHSADERCACMCVSVQSINFNQIFIQSQTSVCMCLSLSLRTPKEGSRQRSCSAPNLRRSPRHSPAIPGVCSLAETGNTHITLCLACSLTSSKRFPFEILNI